MIIVKHRVNTLAGLRQSFPHGVEFDVCSVEGELRVTHEHGVLGPLLAEYLAVAKEVHPPVLAINVKEYGLAPRLEATMAAVDIPHFVFDVPGPELDIYSRSSLVVLGRWSEYECQYSDNLDGTLIDSFIGSEKYPEAVFRSEKNLGVVAVIDRTLRGGEPYPMSVLTGAHYLIRKLP